MLKIEELEDSDVYPDSKQYPNEPWGRNATLGEKYNGAFAAGNQEEADFWLLMIVGHRLRWDSHSLNWKQAFAIEREELAWRALAKDIGDFELYTQGDDGLIERASHREFVAKFYKAALPERITGSASVDILERVHIRREKAAKSRGESYWRKVHGLKPESPTQGGLF